MHVTVLFSDVHTEVPASTLVPRSDPVCIPSDFYYTSSSIILHWSSFCSGHIEILFTGMLVIKHTLLVTSALGWLISGRWVERTKKFGRKGAAVSIMIPVISGTHFYGWGSNPVKIIKIVSFSKGPEGLCG